MNRLIRSILFGGTAAIALTAGTAYAHDMAARPHVAVNTPARVHVAPGPRDRDRADMQREYRKLLAARERFYRGWRGDRHDRDRFERWYAARRVELAPRWVHHRRG